MQVRAPWVATSPSESASPQTKGCSPSRTSSTGKMARVRGRARREGARVAWLDLVDTGSGIPEKIRDRVFDSFLSGRADAVDAAVADPRDQPARQEMPGGDAQRARCRDAEAVHRLRAKELADRRAQHRAAVAHARVGRATAALELKLLGTIGGERFTQEDGAAVSDAIAGVISIGQAALLIAFGKCFPS